MDFTESCFAPDAVEFKESRVSLQRAGFAAPLLETFFPRP
jgi:hypothetical protein